MTKRKEVLDDFWGVDVLRAGTAGPLSPARHSPALLRAILSCLTHISSPRSACEPHAVGLHHASTVPALLLQRSAVDSLLGHGRDGEVFRHRPHAT